MTIQIGNHWCNYATETLELIGLNDAELSEYSKKNVGDIAGFKRSAYLENRIFDMNKEIGWYEQTT